MTTIDLHDYAEKLFHRDCTFIKSVPTLADLLPLSMTEIAFAGRSNVGKSSLINAITSRRGLAHASNTPGRTQFLNFFNLADQLYLVDLPGYGYAEAPKSISAAWNKLILDYLKGRPTLKRVFLLVDSRHGLKVNDIEIMKILDKCAVSYQLVLTKTDKISQGALDKIFTATQQRAEDHTAAHPTIIVTSAEKKTGLSELRTAIAALTFDRDIEPETI